MDSVVNRFLLIIAVAVINLLLLSVAQASAVSYPASHLTATDQAALTSVGQINTFQMTTGPPGSAMGWLAVKGYGIPHRFINLMISDENWDAWEQFQRSSAAMIPVVPITFYKVFSVKIPMELQRERTALPPTQRRPRNLSGLNLLVSTMPPRHRGTIPQAKDPISSGTPWSPVSWLFEGDGLFSPEPWAMNNFIPRAITIVLLLLGGIAFIELTRVVVRLGVRAFASHRGRPEA